MCDILKIAEEELELITNEQNIEKGIEKVRQKYSIPLITVTKGKHGSDCFYADGQIELKASVPTFSNVKTIDTTGAGDTFCACILHEILENGYKNFTQDRLTKMLTFANAAGSLITTKKGALCVMPTKEQIEELMDSAGIDFGA